MTSDERAADNSIRGGAGDPVALRPERAAAEEIASLLREHPGVSDAAVVAVEDDGKERLLGYIVPKRSSQPLWHASSVQLLPNGMPVAHRDENETEQSYNDVFVRRVYGRHGIRIQDDDCIVDASAGIGLFPLYAGRMARNLRLIALEPDPTAFSCLRANAEVYGAAVRCLPRPFVAGKAAEAAPHHPAFANSPDAFLSAVLEAGQEQDSEDVPAHEDLDRAQFAAEISEMSGESSPARQARSAQLLARWMAEESIHRIDLLKVNLHGGGLGALSSLANEEWEKIRQCVIEARREELQPLLGLLREHGYEFHVEEDSARPERQGCFLYARRPSATGPADPREEVEEATTPLAEPVGEELLAASLLRSFLKEKLPPEMIPAEFELREAIPRTAEGTVDRASLTPARRHVQTVAAGGAGKAIAEASAQATEAQASAPMSDAERRKILYEWNQTSAEIPSQCVHELFERQVERSPEAAAVVCGERSLSYRELNQRANRIAHYLRRNGVGPERLVGVCLRRSPELVAALLGVWKAGGAYVPLDPTYPPERLSFLAQDAAVQVLLTEERLASQFSSFPGQTVCLDSQWPVIAQESDGNPESGASPENLAYVMYTSGSTGLPKGAMILHRGLVNYLTWAIREYGVEAGGSVPLHSSISFDLTVTSLYPALLAGGQVELLEEDLAAQSLLAALRLRKGRTLVKITPAHLEHLSHQLNPQEIAEMTRAFVIGGESLRAENLRMWREFAPETRLINEYGPTETVVGCCTYEVQAGDPQGGTVPIGRPIANTQLYVLDSNLQPVRPGETGQLYIGGAGVARGYWRRPELTAERFLPDSFSQQPGARMYKSGDLARYRADGVLECLGRADTQVKIRGYRIELGEIEAVLAGHTAVRSCAVLAREDAPGTRQLVGYVSAAEGQSPTPNELRTFLAQRLPEFMIPAQFVFLESLPLTANGKVDRKALPAPAPASATEEAQNAPQDVTEQLLARIWAKALNLRRVGRTENFFDLGGHSLLAVRIMVEVEKVMKVQLPLATLLEAPTVAEMAKILNDSQWKPAWSTLVPLRPRGGRPPLFLMHAHGGNVLEYHALAELLGSDQPVYAFQARGLDGRIPAGMTLETMAAAYLEELRHLQPEGPYFLGGFCFGGYLALEAAHQLRASGEEVGLVALLQTPHPERLLYRPKMAAHLYWWRRLCKQIDLELENWSNVGNRYLRERFRRALDLLAARRSLASDEKQQRVAEDLSQRPKLYVFEALHKEHTRALRQYVPRPYSGDVVLFRCSKQLRGQAEETNLGWDGLLTGKLELCEVPGHQQNLMLLPNVRKLVAELAPRLLAAQEHYLSGIGAFLLSSGIYLSSFVESGIPM